MHAHRRLDMGFPKSTKVSSSHIPPRSSIDICPVYIFRTSQLFDEYGIWKLPLKTHPCQFIYDKIIFAAIAVTKGSKRA